MTTILEQIQAGARLVATPPNAVGERWTYKMNGKDVLLTAGQFLEVQRDPSVWVERLRGDRILYRAMTREERTDIRAKWRAWKKKRRMQ